MAIWRYRKLLLLYFQCLDIPSFSFNFVNRNVNIQIGKRRDLDASRKVVIANKVLDFESEAVVKQPFVCRAALGCHNDS